VINLRKVPGDQWQGWDVMIRDLPLALVLALVSLPAFHGHGTQIAELPPRPFDAPAVAVIALECLPLVVRRRRPAACLALVSLGFALDQFYSYFLVASIALPIALLSAGAHLQRYRRTATVLVSAGYVLLIVGLWRQGATEGVIGFLTVYLALAFAWGIGAWLRQTRAAEVEHRSRVAEATRTAERTRIARELHDVVTHHVTAMVVQAEAARYLSAAPERLDQSLTAITDTGRRAITDLRHLLDLLNPDHSTEPRTPSVGELQALVEQTRQAGQPVEFAEDGTPSQASGSAEFVAYRVVQEALTNALKYAHGSRTTVHVHHGEREITVEIGTDGTGSQAGSPGGSGRGLAGLRERVDVLGGQFSAERRLGGGFVVHARIPVGTGS
jgi:signal transduction histidine kinase